MLQLLAALAGNIGTLGWGIEGLIQIFEPSDAEPPE